MRSFKKLAGLALVATATLGVFAPLEGKATPSPGEAWADVADAEPCIPQVSVSDNVVDNTIRIRVVQGNTCPISDKVFLFIQDDRPQPLRLPGIRANFLSDTWVVQQLGQARPGRYRVMGINPTPNGIGDNEYISARHLRIDQVITIGQGQEQSAPTPPPVVLPPAPRQETPSEPSQAQGSTLAIGDIIRCLLSTPIRFVGWSVDFSPWKACLPR